MIDKSKLLSSLGLKDINQGSSTGYQWLNSSGKKSDVFSPVDGNKISSVVETDEDTYEKIIEAASSFGWHKYINENDLLISIDEFGESGKGDDLFDFFGFNCNNIIDLIKKKILKWSH